MHSTEKVDNSQQSDLGLSNIIILAIYRNILKVSILRYFLINYRDTISVQHCH